MTNTVETTVTDTPATTQDTPTAAPDSKGRTRYSFGAVWVQAVKEGKVKDQEKLVAHAIKLQVADARALQFSDLLARVQAALTA